MVTSGPAAAGVYRISCIPTGKVYVGSARSIRRRWRRHVALLTTGAHHNRHLQRAWNKYGETAFRFDVVELVPVGLLLDVEQRHIDEHPDAFNIRREAGSNRGVKWSEETKAKMSAAAKGRTASAEAKANMSAAGKRRMADPLARAKASAINKGRLVTAETRALIGARHKGMKHTAETKAAIGSKNRGRVRSPEVRAKISATLRGHKRTETVRARMSEAQSSYQAAKREAAAAGAAS